MARRDADDGSRKLLWLIAARAAVISAAARLGQSHPDQPSPGAFPVDPFFVLIGLTFALTVVYGADPPASSSGTVAGRRAGGLRRADRLGHRALTGGVDSYFSSLYTLPIIAASAMQSWRGGMLVGMLSSLVYAGVVLAQYVGAPASPVVDVAQELPPLRVALFTVGLNSFGFFAVAA